MSQEIIEGIQAIEKEKGIEEGVLITALEDALRAAYKKTPGATRHAEVKLDDVGEFRVFGIEIPEDIEVRLVEEAREARIIELEQLEEETGERQHTLITDDDLELDWSQVPPDKILRTDVTPDNFGRIAAQTAKQVIQQRIREAERAIMYEEYVDRQGEVVTGIVQQAGDRNNVLVDLGRVEALLPRSEQVDGERYEQGSRIKAVIAEVRSGTKGPQVILSRRDPELIRALFELEVPEIADGLVEIRGVAREPGYRSKIAVESHMQGVDPVGACVGTAWLPRTHGRLGAPRREDRHHPVEHGARSLRREGAVARARPRGVHRRRDAGGDGRRPERPARTRDRQGGPERPPGHAADRLEDRHPVRAGVRAGRGRGRVRGNQDGEEFSGRCAAVLSNGKRCPNAALPGSRYCGVPAHQALANQPAGRTSRPTAKRSPPRRRSSSGPLPRRSRRPKRSPRWRRRSPRPRPSWRSPRSSRMRARPKRRSARRPEASAVLDWTTDG